MSGYSDELRLALVLVLNIGLFASAYRFARRRGGVGAIQAVCDAFLLYFLVEYASVSIPGALGVFSWATMSLLAAAAAGGLWFAAGKGAPESIRIDPIDPDRLGLIACSIFVIGFAGAYAWFQRWVPVMATDSLVYHLPTVVQWIQTGKLGIYPTWYWNPAASYSPATGMTFMAWLMAPPQCDVFVRFVQLPPLIFIYFLTVRLCRVMGCARTAAGLIGIAAALSRALFSEAVFPKDDLFVTAFVVAAVVSFQWDALRDRLGPWRMGVALGFVLASKYTVLLVCPVFLFLVDAPFRAGWRAKQIGIVLAIVLLMAAPWYVRTTLLTGNPLYPVDVRLFGLHLPGLFTTERDQQLRTSGGIWHMLAQTYHSLPMTIIALLAIGWVAALIAGRRQVLRDPLRRACTIGSVATLLIFLAASPHHEVRYMFPLFVLWFASLGLAIAGWIRRPAIQAAVALVPAAISTATSFDKLFVVQIAEFSAVAFGLALLAVAVLYVQLRLLKLSIKGLIGVGAAAALALAVLIYVNWHAYLSTYLASQPALWARSAYDRQAPLWQFMAEQVPTDASVAYANTYFVYPLYDPMYLRHVGYAPIRKGLHRFLALPRLGDRVPGDLILPVMATDMNADPDLATWLANLRELGASYLVINKHEIVPDPPELRFARAHPDWFHPIFEDDDAIVFALRLPPE